MRILGIGPEVWISSAALIQDGVVVAGAAEERFDRQKTSRKFPRQAIRHCLQTAQCAFEDVDYLAVAWNPAKHMRSYNYRFSDATRWRAELLTSIPNNALQLCADKEVDHVQQDFVGADHTTKIVYVTHHLAHAASAFYLSPFQDAAVITVDGRGEDQTAFFGLGSKNKITNLQTIAFPHSLGLVYSAVTDFLGFKAHVDEWKVMALASYGTRDNAEYDKLKKILILKEDGSFEFDLSYFNYYLADQTVLYSPKFVGMFGGPRQEDEELTERHYAIAAALQQVTEEVLVHMLRWLYEQTKMENLVVGGGVFMNSVFNGKIRELTPFKNVFISSCPDDSGVSVGAAAYVYHDILGLPRMQTPTDNYWGPEFSDATIKETLEKYKLTAVRMPDVESYAARLLQEGRIIGWFQGKMEFGQRALGNRSILASPTIAEMKDLVNRIIKYRESFRPFAPSVLEESVAEYFECKPEDRVPFMERVYMIRPEKRDVIPAVVHVDGSGRLQTVSKETNPRYHKLISEFEKLTGIPVLLNTSFNLKGEAIVCTPTDAIRTFMSSGLDALVLGNYVILKSSSMVSSSV